MNKRGRVLVLVLAEDDAQQRFIYHYLRKQFGSHEIRFAVAPVGKGSAERWVRERYAEKVRQYRTRAGQTRLVVMIDADTGTVAERQLQLRTALDLARLDRRTNEERIAHLIPKRNIETWILCLNGQLVKEQQINEDQDYKPLKIDDQIKPAAEEFFNWSRPNADVPEKCVDSIHLAILEVRKIE